MAIVNETPQEKLIRELREENERLKHLVEGRGGSGTSNQPIDEEARREFLAQIEELKREKEEAEKTMQERLQEASFRRTQTVAKVEITSPHLMNLNEDPILTGHIKHAFKPGENVAGKPNDASQPDIPIQGLGVEENHCLFRNENGRISILPGRSESAKVVINGEALKGPRELRHEDRVRIGNHLFFLFVDPAQPRNQDIDWGYASKEANEREIQGILGAKEEEMRRKMQEERELAMKQIEEERQKLTKLSADKEHKDQETQKLLEDKEREVQARKLQVEEELRLKEADLRKMDQDIKYKHRVEEALSNAFKLTNDANARSSMLGKKPRFKPEFYRAPGPDGRLGKGYENTKVRMRVLLPELDESVKLYWDTDKMEGRLPDMQEMTEQYLDGTPLEQINIGYDPFAVSEDDIETMGGEGLIGQTSILVQALYHFLDIDEQNPVYDLRGGQVGTLHVKIVPRLEEGLDMEEFDSMEEVPGHQITWQISLLTAADLPASLSKNVNCRYTLPWIPAQETFRTEPAQGRNPTFHYQKDHVFVATKENARQIKEFSLTVFVFGEAPDEVKATAARKLAAVTGKPDLQPAAKQAPSKKSAVVEEVQPRLEDHKGEEVKRKEAPKDPRHDEAPREEVKDSQRSQGNPSSKVVPEASKPSKPTQSKGTEEVKTKAAVQKPAEEDFKSKPSPYSVNQSYPTTTVTNPTVSQPIVLVPESQKLVVKSDDKKSSCCAAF